MAIAFFDFDGTLIQKDSGVICALPSIRRGLLGPRLGARLIATYLLSKAGLRTRVDAQRVGFECYAGRTLEELRNIMAELYERNLKPWISSPMRARVEAHKKRADATVILTASAYWFAEPLAADLGLDTVIGTKVAFEKGLCTGIVDGEILDGPQKRQAARAYAEERGERLEDATFYSDHIADLPLLEAVGIPVAVGPHAPLYRVAKQRGWAIVSHSGVGEEP